MEIRTTEVTCFLTNKTHTHTLMTGKAKIWDLQIANLKVLLDLYCQRNVDRYMFENLL